MALRRLALKRPDWISRWSTDTAAQAGVARLRTHGRNPVKEQSICHKEWSLP